MPTIDELAPATSASDSDEIFVSQAGIARKITRAQVLNGVQPQIAMPSGVLLGRISTGTGGPEVVAVGPNLLLSGNTLTATATPFFVNGLGSGSVPGPGDLIAMSQSGTNVAVTFGQLLNGIPSVPNVDISQALVTPSGGTTTTLALLTGHLLPMSGGTLTGNLTLAGSPRATNQAANKGYVDQQYANSLNLSGGSMSGALTLSGPPVRTLDAATKVYVDSAVSALLPLSGGSLAGALILDRAPTNNMQAATKVYADQKISRSGDTLGGALVLAADPVTANQAATKNYVDVQASGLVAKSGGTLTGSLVLASDPTLGAQAATKQYVDLHLSRSGDTLSGMLSLAADPTSPGQAATKNYVDAQVAGTVLRSGSSMVGGLLLATDPSLPLQAATKQYADLKIARIGDTLTGALYLAADPVVPLQASTKNYVDSQFAGALTTGGGTFTGPVTLAADPALPLQAATKQYVDTRLLRTGDTLTGVLALAADPVAGPQAATKNYVDAEVLSRLPLAGGSISGTLTLGAIPTMPGHASPKQYVDSQVATALPLTGGTVSGSLSLATAPTSAQSAATKQYVDSQIANVLPVTGGSMSGSLTLAGAPNAPLQAATKSYVDANPNSARVVNVTLPPYGAKINGTTDDTAAFMAAYQAAPTGGVIYVPNGVTVLQQPGTWGVALTKFVKWIVDGTTLPDGTPLASGIPTGGAPCAFVLPGIAVGTTQTGTTMSQGASRPSDFAINQSAYIVNHSGGTNGAVAANTRTDTIIYASPGNYIWGGLDRLLWCGTQTPVAATAAQHVARYVQTVRQACTIGPNGTVLPQPQLWAACLEYRDTTGMPSSATNASLTIEMDWFGNGLDDANCRTIQSLVIGQANTSGAPVEVANIIGVYLAGGSSGSAKTVFGIGVPFSNAVLDSTWAQSINNAPVIKLAAGQAIAFESTNSNRLLYNSSTNTLCWKQGSLSYVVGKGITVGWVNVYSGNGTLPNYISGNLIILNGSSNYSISLPAASTVAAGTGFTFTALGSGAVSIVPNGSDSVDCGPIVLHPNDRYHIVSDGQSSWHEIFRTNAVSPRFTAPIVLPSYTVATLPASSIAGAKAFTANGRKPSEAAGAGSGVEVFYDGTSWISSCSGTAVAA